MNRLTINLNCGEYSPFNYELKARMFLRESTSDWVFLLNAKPDWVDDALKNKKKVVIRFFDPFSEYFRNGTFDNSFDQRHSPEDTAAALERNYPNYRNNPNVYFTIGYNEPSYRDIEKQCDWFIRFANSAMIRGYRVVLGEWNTAKSIKVLANGECPDIDSGKWDKLLQFASDNREWVILGFHEYTFGLAWAQQLDNFPNVLLDENIWSKVPRPSIWNSPNANGQWHIFRIAPLIHRMNTKNLKARFAISESILDRMDDIGQIMTEIRARFGLPEFSNEVSGFPSLRKYYDHIAKKGRPLTDAEFSRMCYDQAKYIDEEYPSCFEYIAFFAFNGNNQWRKTDVSRPEMAGFLNSISIHQTKGDVDMPEYNGKFENANITNIHNRIERTIRRTPMPNTSSNIVFNLGVGETFNAQTAVETINANGYAWRAFMYEGEVVYVAEYGLGYPTNKFITVSFTEEPTDIIGYLKDKGILSETVSEEEIKDIIELYSILENLNYYPKNVVDYFRNMNQELIKFF